MVPIVAVRTCDICGKGFGDWHVTYNLTSPYRNMDFHWNCLYDWVQLQGRLRTERETSETANSEPASGGQDMSLDTTHVARSRPGDFRPEPYSVP